MRGDAQRVKERVDIAELIGGYIKLEKAGANFKARCPFHTEKTASFHISPERQTYYCFGCGKKGDAFTFIEEMEGTDFKGALKFLADKTGVELEYAPRESHEEKDRLYAALEEACAFYEDELSKSREAHAYIISRGITDESIKKFRLGYAENDWRRLRTHMLAKGFTDMELAGAGLIKRSEEKGGEHYDVFRGRIMFPLSDASGRIVAFSGRAIEKDAIPKYLNSPDTLLFQKSEVLYGLDKAKESIRKKNYAILVEGQMDLVLSHQAGVDNTVASSGTAFTELHLNRLMRLSKRIILAFDGDSAGEKAAFKSTELALGLGMEVKVASLDGGKDPADLVRESVESWKNVLRSSRMAIEFFLERVIESESDNRKLGKLVEKTILPLVALVESAIERSHFVSLIAKRTGIREEVLWDDLKKYSSAHKSSSLHSQEKSETVEEGVKSKTLIERIEERLNEVRYWKKEVPENDASRESLDKEEKELLNNLSYEQLREKLAVLITKLARAESLKDDEEVSRLTGDIQAVHKELKDLEGLRKVW
jgi:DNA primase